MPHSGRRGVYWEDAEQSIPGKTRVRDGQSILDDVRGQIKTLTSNVGTTDRQRLDLYLTSVRESEQRLQQDVEKDVLRDRVVYFLSSQRT